MNYTEYVPFEIGKKYHLKIQQKKTYFEIVVDDLQVFSQELVFSPSNCKNVAVYISDPMYDAFTSEYGTLQNFKYTLGK